MYKKITDLTGKRYGKLVVTGLAKDRIKGKVTWTCKCDCGNTIDIIGVYLTKAKGTKSCGCICKKHGMFGTRIYNVWHTMKERCYVPTHISYSNYGEKGIRVCDEWHDFIPFMEWAYANGYDENAPRGQCTLDRIDPNGHYSPENCRWVDVKMQANNRTNNVYIEYNGIVDTLTNHARNAKLDPRIVESRKVNGDSSDRLFRDIRKPRTIEYRGENYTVNEFCKKFKVSRSPVEKRIFINGEDVEQALKNIKANKKKPMKKNRQVLQYDKNMNLLKEWKNLNTIRNELGFNCSAIRNCCLGNTKTSQGFIWKYKD